MQADSGLISVHMQADSELISVHMQADSVLISIHMQGDDDLFCMLKVIFATNKVHTGGGDMRMGTTTQTERAPRIDPFKPHDDKVTEHWGALEYQRDRAD